MQKYLFLDILESKEGKDLLEYELVKMMYIYSSTSYNSSRVSVYYFLHYGWVRARPSSSLVLLARVDLLVNAAGV